MVIAMNNITRRIEKLETVLLREKDIDFESMTPEQRRHRIAELTYIGLCDTDPEVMNITEQEFISMYLSMSPADREAKYDRPIYEQLKAKYDRPIYEQLKGGAGE